MPLRWSKITKYIYYMVLMVLHMKNYYVNWKEYILFYKIECNKRKSKHYFLLPMSIIGWKKSASYDQCLVKLGKYKET